MPIEVHHAEFEKRHLVRRCLIPRAVTRKKKGHRISMAPPTSFRASDSSQEYRLGKTDLSLSLFFLDDD